MTERLNCKLSSCARRYVTLCFLKFLLNLCWIGEPPSSLRCAVVRTRSSISPISSNALVPSSDIDCVVSTASWEWIESGAWRTWLVCLSIKEKCVTPLEMAWTSSPAFATSELTAFSVRESLKPSAATRLIELPLPVGKSCQWVYTSWMADSMTYLCQP